MSSRIRRIFQQIYKLVTKEQTLPAAISRQHVDDLTSHERFVPEFHDTEPWAKDHLERYKFATQYITPQDNVLDIACGSGYGSEMLGQNGAKVIGIDYSDGAIQHARSNYKAEFFVGDFFDSIPGHDTFDCVISFETIEHIDAPVRKSLNHLVRKANRVLIGSVPFNEKPGNPYHRHFHIAKKEIEFLKKYGKLTLYFQEAAPSSRIGQDIAPESAQNIIFVLIKDI